MSKKLGKNSGGKNIWSKIIVQIRFKIKKILGEKNVGAKNESEKSLA